MAFPWIALAEGMASCKRYLDERDNYFSRLKELVLSTKDYNSFFDRYSKLFPDGIMSIIMNHTKGSDLIFDKEKFLNEFYDWPEQSMIP